MVFLISKLKYYRSQTLTLEISWLLSKTSINTSLFKATQLISLYCIIRICSVASINLALLLIMFTCFWSLLWSRFISDGHFKHFRNNKIFLVRGRWNLCTKLCVHIALCSTGFDWYIQFNLSVLFLWKMISIK